MCGIVGFIAKKQDENTIKKMLHVQEYRGPDDRGIFVEKINHWHVHFGHNRLSIQDISIDGHQPFISICGEYSIVFNGEVYNFKVIRKTLEKLGHSFRSKTDTEVILYAYKEWGIECLERFIGMFSFSILDKQKKKLFLVRDRVGVKPLYYYDDGKTFLFSSELKSFHEHKSFEKVLNKDALPYYFQMGYIPAPYSIYKNTFKLEPGHYLEYDLLASNYELVQYWSIDTCYEKEKLDKSEVEVLSDLETLLEDAVDLRMVSDVPVGVFLSGGYDSSLVTALLSKKHKNLQTYTIGFEDQKLNEALHAKEIAKYLGTKHTEHYVSTKDMLSKIETLPFYYDEPFGDSSAIPTMMVSELAKKDVTVALSADGGDESFCGYSKYFFLDKFSSVFSSHFKKKILQTTLKNISPKIVTSMNEMLPKKFKQTNVSEKYTKFTHALNAHSLDEMFLNASSPVARERVEKMLKNPMKENYFKSFSSQSKHKFIDDMMRIDYKTFLTDDVLTKVDRATMSVSLEGREPLLDHRIIEYMASVPVRLKYKDQKGKYLLREILYKHIPKALIDKPKSGFQVPLNTWLTGDLKYLIEKYLDPSHLDDEIFDCEEIERIKKELFLGDFSRVNQIWFILMYEMWKEKWF